MYTSKVKKKVQHIHINKNNKTFITHNITPPNIIINNTKLQLLRHLSLNFSRGACTKQLFLLFVMQDFSSKSLKFAVNKRIHITDG